MILGIEDPIVVLAYALSFAGMVACVIYGICNWRVGDEPTTEEDVQWAREEKKEIEESL